MGVRNSAVEFGGASEPVLAALHHGALHGGAERVRIGHDRVPREHDAIICGARGRDGSDTAAAAGYERVAGGESEPGKERRSM